MTTTDLPDWIYEGAKVADVDNYGRVTLVTIERLTPTQIVTETSRYRRVAPYPRIGGDTWSPGHNLEPLTAPRVRDARARQSLGVMGALVEKVSRLPSDAGVAEALAALDQIEGLVAKSRATVEKMSKEKS